MGLMMVNGRLYSGGSGTLVEANPSSTPTDTLSSLGIDGTIYELEGGGGDASKIELTQLEYDALTEEEKNNGTMYFITDANDGEGKGFQPIIYSLTEREIGVWTDGKPLYQKTVAFGALPSGGEKSVAHGISNIEEVASCVAVAYNPTSGLRIALPFVNGGSDRAGVYVTSTDITATLSTNLSGYTDTQVTIQYTKTTDTPGSGTWTPQGVPASHYSTEEQIVGTWITGETLYEKSYIMTNTSSGYTIFDFTDLTPNNVTNVHVHEATAFAPAESGVSNASAPMCGYLMASAGELGFVGYITGNTETNTYQLHYRVGGYLSGGSAYVTLHYTKPTS